MWNVVGCGVLREGIVDNKQIKEKRGMYVYVSEWEIDMKIKIIIKVYIALNEQ